MRFRGKMNELVSIRLFAQLLHTLQKCSKTFVIRVMPEKLVVVLSEKDSNTTTGSGGTTAWCEIPQESYFSEYNMEGVAPDANEIYMEVSSEMVASSVSSLKSSNNVVSFKMKLTKKLVPCLTFEIETQSTNSTVICTHDIPITVIGRRHWHDFQEPNLPDFNVSLQMPDLKVIRQALDRMKNLGPKLTVNANKLTGNLKFSVETYSVNCSVTFPDLRAYDIKDNETNEEMGQSSSRPDSDENMISVEVDMKCIQHLIPAEATKPSNFICSLVDGRLLHFYYFYGDVSLQYCIPGGSNNNVSVIK